MTNNFRLSLMTHCHQRTGFMNFVFRSKIVSFCSLTASALKYIMCVKAREEGGGGGKSFKKPKKLLFPKSIHFLTTEILLPLIYL